MNDVDSGIDGRAISRELLAGWIAAWREGWLAAGRMQQENPAMMRLGLASPSDPAEAIGGILHVLACTHPQFQSAVVAMLEMVEEELVKDVPPLAHDSPVANDEHGEASDAPDRLAQLEAEVAELRRALRVVSSVAEAATRPPSDTPTATHPASSP